MLAEVLSAIFPQKRVNKSSNRISYSDRKNTQNGCLIKGVCFIKQLKYSKTTKYDVFSWFCVKICWKPCKTVFNLVSRSAIAIYTSTSWPPEDLGPLGQNPPVKYDLKRGGFPLVRSWYRRNGVLDPPFGGVWGVPPPRTPFRPFLVTFWPKKGQKRRFLTKKHRF